MTTLIARLLSQWFPVEDLTIDQWQRLWKARHEELYAQWNAGLFPRFQSSASSDRESVNVR